MQAITGKRKLILYGCSGLGVNLLNIIVGSYLCSALLVGGFVDHVGEWTFLGIDLVIPSIWIICVIIGKVVDGIIDLPFANFLNKLKSKIGKRKAGILIGFIPMVVIFVLFTFPLTEIIGMKPGADGNLTETGLLINTIWFGVLLCLFYAFYTFTMLAYYATFSEVTKDEKDCTFLSNTKSICDVAYFSLGFALIPVFINLNINISIIALIFLPLSLTMMIPMFLLKEKDATYKNIEKASLIKSLKVAFKNKPYITWTLLSAFMSVGLQLFLSGINELFSSVQLNMTAVMASSFAPVPFTLILFNKLMKKKGLVFAYRYSALIFGAGMLIMLLCFFIGGSLVETGNTWALYLIAISGGILISFSLGAFFSTNYIVPTRLAQLEEQKTKINISAMLYAVQGLFEGIAAGLASGLILTLLKENNVIWVAPIVIFGVCATVFGLSHLLPKTVKEIGKREEEKQ